MSSENFVELFTQFINEWPLYSSLEVKVTPSDLIFSVPSFPNTILRECRTCDATPTWVSGHPAGLSSRNGSRTEHIGVGSVIAYQCSHCRKEDLRLWYCTEEIRHQDNNKGLASFILRKFGQWPAQSVNPSREVEKALNDKEKDFFKKGLTSLSHGFGVGALAYFRRVVEEVTGTVLDLFASQAQAIGELEAEEKIRAAKQNRQMTDQLKIAAEALPPTLRPSGANPLLFLYDNYSRGIHGLSDEQCLEVAKDLYFSFDYIFRNWRLQMEEASKFRNAVNRSSDLNKVAKNKT